MHVEIRNPTAKHNVSIMTEKPRDPTLLEQLNKQESASTHPSVLSHTRLALNMNVDWAFTALCINALNGKTEFNADNDFSFFTVDELDVVLDLIKQNFEKYRPTDAITPYYRKAMATL
jgi:hypothetical protein